MKMVVILKKKVKFIGYLATGLKLYTKEDEVKTGQIIFNNITKDMSIESDLKLTILDENTPNRNKLHNLIKKYLIEKKFEGAKDINGNVIPHNETYAMKVLKINKDLAIQIKKDLSKEEYTTLANDINTRTDSEYNVVVKQMETAYILANSSIIGCLAHVGFGFVEAANYNSVGVLGCIREDYETLDLFNIKIESHE